MRAADPVVEGLEFRLCVDRTEQLRFLKLGGFAEDEGNEARLEGWVDPGLERSIVAVVILVR